MKTINKLFFLGTFAIAFISNRGTSETGVIYNLAIDGCEWMVELMDGSMHEINNLREFVQNPVNGQSISAKFELYDEDSVCMLGKKFRIVNLEF